MTTWYMCSHGCVTTDENHFTGDHVRIRSTQLTNPIGVLSMMQFRAFAKKRAMEYRQEEFLNRLMGDPKIDDGLGCFRGLVSVAKVYLAVGIAVGVCFLIARYM